MTRKLRVAYDDRWQGGGIGRVCAEMLARLQSGGMDLRPLGVGSKISAPLSPWILARHVSRSDADVFWSPGFMPPSRCAIPCVITIHDLIHREYGGALRRIYYDTVIRPFVKSVATILTGSVDSKTRIEQWLGAHAPPVVVVSNGVSEAFRPDGTRYRGDAPYALYCGNQRSHKNIARMLEAFASSPAARGLALYMTGTAEDSTASLIRRFGLDDRIQWLGNVDEERLAEVYRGAEFLMLVSLEEGFGLPVVEAMASGTPALCSNTTSLGEIAGDAALTVDPRSVEDIRDGIERMVNDSALRERLRQAGPRRAADFNWDRVAQRVGQVLESVANR